MYGVTHGGQSYSNDNFFQIMGSKNKISDMHAQPQRHGDGRRVSSHGAVMAHACFNFRHYYMIPCRVTVACLSRHTMTLDVDTIHVTQKSVKHTVSHMVTHHTVTTNFFKSWVPKTKFGTCARKYIGMVSAVISDDTARRLRVRVSKIGFGPWVH